VIRNTYQISKLIIRWLGCVRTLRSFLLFHIFLFCFVNFNIVFIYLKKIYSTYRIVHIHTSEKMSIKTSLVFHVHKGNQRKMQWLMDKVIEKKNKQILKVSCHAKYDSHRLTYSVVRFKGYS